MFKLCKEKKKVALLGMLEGLNEQILELLQV